MGADGFRILMLLSNEFVRILGIAIVIGTPLSYFVNNLWLEKLPNREVFGVDTLIWGVSVLVVLGTLAIGSQTLRASPSNPVEALKSE